MDAMLRAGLKVMFGIGLVFVGTLVAAGGPAKAPEELMASQSQISRVVAR
jgi:hypothetical protein